MKCECCGVPSILGHAPDCYMMEGRSKPKVISNLGVKVQVQSGDTWKFLCNMSTRAGHVHPKGSLLHVHDKTTEAPHGEIGESGFNWWCRTEFGLSIWATLEQCIARGLLKKVDGP